MTYRGRVKNGMIVLDQAAELPEGQEVSVRVLPQKSQRPKKLPSFSERMKRFAGAVEAPPDLARNHDHYLYGLPKK